MRGLVEGLGALTVFILWLEVLGASVDLARTAAFTVIVVDELLEAHGTRSLYRTIIALGPLKNLYLVAATLVGFGLQLAVVYLPPMQEAFHTEGVGLREWLAVAVMGSIRLLVVEGLKVSPWRLRP